MTRARLLLTPSSKPSAPQVIVPLMVTVFFAKLVGDALSYSIYDTHIKIRGAPVLVRPQEIASPPGRAPCPCRPECP